MGHTPIDEFDRQWQKLTHPPTWTNARPQPSQYDLVVIGGGTAGLVSAVGAAGLGARVALVERSFLGGDCLGAGCVPSKALLRSARAIAETNHAPALGIETAPAQANFAAIMAQMRRLRSEISHHDSAERMASLGIDLYFGEARFVGRREVTIGTTQLRFKRCILATGGRAGIPDTPGLNTLPYLTNESLFRLENLPAHLLVIGGGPIGCEMAQAFRRFGSQVTILTRSDRLLNNEAPAASQILEETFRTQGITLHKQADILRFQASSGLSTSVEFQSGTLPSTMLEADAILMATGRKSNTEGLGLDAAGVALTKSDIKVNAYLQTTNPAIFAAGDCIGGPQFTHAADAMARICLQNAFYSFGWLGKKRFRFDHVPHTTYTQPEIASIGLSAAAASAQNIPIDTYTMDLAQVDRAHLDGAGSGFAQVYCKRGTGQILGGSIVSPHAGELMGELGLAIQLQIPLGKIGSVMHCYPTEAEILKRLADQYSRTRLTPLVANLLRTIIRWRS